MYADQASLRPTMVPHFSPELRAPVEDELSDYILQLNLNEGDKLATEPHSQEVAMPHWGAAMRLIGQRDYSHVFRLPNMGGWIQKWVYARGAEVEVVPERALTNSTAESTTVFRALAKDRMAIPVLSTHWFLCPYQSLNGFTVGLAFMDVLLDRLDEMTVPTAACGRFALDEATGEMFLTAYNKDGFMHIAWTQSVSSCERVREVFLFSASDQDGAPPERVLVRNSFYERRNCRICGDAVASSLLKVPCNSPASRPTDFSSERAERGDYLFPLQNVYRRFRGNFFGTCVKTLYTYDNGATPSRRTAQVPLFLDIRHGVASVARRLKINLKQSAVSFGLDPRVSSRILFLPPNQPLTIEGAEPEPNGNVSGHTASESSSHAAVDNGRCPVDAQRIRNADGLDRESVLHLRKVRNRESARRTNEERKRKYEANKAELADLRTKVPLLRMRQQELQYENMHLRERVALADALDPSAGSVMSDQTLSSFLGFSDEGFQ